MTRIPSRPSTRSPIAPSVLSSWPSAWPRSPPSRCWGTAVLAVLWAAAGILTLAIVRIQRPDGTWLAARSRLFDVGLGIGLAAVLLLLSAIRQPAPHPVSEEQAVHRLSSHGDTARPPRVICAPESARSLVRCGAVTEWYGTLAPVKTSCRFVSHPEGPFMPSNPSASPSLVHRLSHSILTWVIGAILLALLVGSVRFGATRSFPSPSAMSSRPSPACSTSSSASPSRSSSSAW